MKRLLAMALLMMSAPAWSASVVVADGDWSYLPELKNRGYDNLHSKVTARLYELVKERQCRLPGQGYQQLNFRMTFAAEFEPNGTLKKIVIPRLNCPEAESILGGALLEMFEAGDYRSPGNNPYGWYRGDISFGMIG